MIDELRQIAIFAKTVEQGSFRAAGKALRLSPSVVSHHVAQLEQHLGTPLLYRSTRKLALTEDGKKLLVAARAMLEAAETGMRHLSREGEILSGSLRLTIPAMLNNTDLLSHIADFSNSNTEVNISLDSSDIRRDIIADGYDVAVTVGPLKNKSLKTKKLFELRRMLVVSKEYAKKHKPPQSPSDLNDWQWCELNPGAQTKPAFYKGNKRVSISKHQAQISVNNTNALIDLVVSGAGIAILPHILVKNLQKTGHVRQLLKDWTIESQDVSAVWPPNVTSKGTVMSFVSYLTDAIADYER